MFTACIFTFSSSDLEIFNELHLIKSILPYVDRIILHSPKAYLISSIISVAYLSNDQKVELITSLAPSLTDTYSAQNIKNALEMIKKLKNNRHKSTQEICFLKKFERDFSKVFKEFEMKIEEISNQSGLTQLASLFEQKIIEFQSYDLCNNNLANVIINQIETNFSNKDHYPLFDDKMGNLVSSAVNEGIIKLPEILSHKGKNIKIASNFLEKLPALDSLSIESLLDIRDELKNPLIRFRAAIQSFSEQIESHPWDEEFFEEIQVLYIKYVEPALIDLEEAFKSNNYFTKFLIKSIDKTTAMSFESLIGIGIAKAFDFPGLALASIAPAATLSANAIKTYFEWKDKKREIEKNSMFFFYKLKGKIK